MKEATISLIRMQAKNIHRKAKQLELLAGIEEGKPGEWRDAVDAQRIMVAEMAEDLGAFQTTLEKTFNDLEPVERVMECPNENPGSL